LNMRVLVTGGTGFIGRPLMARLLERGDSVTALTRRVPEGAAASSASFLSGASSPSKVARGQLRWVKWDPTADGAWQDELADHDAVVHLAGETAAGRRYTDAVKQEILTSRVESTTRIVRAIERSAGLVPRGQGSATFRRDGGDAGALGATGAEGSGQNGEHKSDGRSGRGRPEVLVCASGVGFYGGREDAKELDESAPAGTDFLAQVCVAWEGAARQAENVGVRVVCGRIGFVLGKGGGALARLVPIFKAFAGGPLGKGRQMVPWIHIDDVVGAFLKAVDDRTLSGPMNVTAPTPVTNAELSRALGRALGRPALLPAPSFALKALFGEGAVPILTGQAAVPRALTDHGFRHRFTDLDAALRDVLRD
jgi:NAD dependent epimerase/dehydratase family enzyme